ncbi:hypothetical protein ACA910_003424 [Epithemia clementina (nom. ined.)]
MTKSNSNNNNNNNKTRSITILVLGDEQVGKSSLIATFVSRYFSDSQVPGLMTRVQLPPTTLAEAATWQVEEEGNHHHNNNHNKITASSRPSLCRRRTTVTTVLVDSQRADVALQQEQAMMMMMRQRQQQQQQQQQQPAEHQPPNTGSTTPPPLLLLPRQVDSILLVYDLSRPETLVRLEHHWLPLIQHVYHGKVPVIVAENKHDLLPSAVVPSPVPSAAAPKESSASMQQQQQQQMEQHQHRRRQQIVALMQRFPFVRQCIKCSAKEFLHVDDIFLKAQQAVLYPFNTPALYDLERARLSVSCQRALHHIFRLYDVDRNQLLTDQELHSFSQQVVDLEQAVGADWSTWKKIVRGQHQQQQQIIMEEETTAAATPTTGAAAGASPNENKDVLVVLPDGTTAFTVAGFWAIFDVLIHQNRLDCVWETLRNFGYSDELELSLLPATTSVWSDWTLPWAERQFLVQLFEQYATVSSSSSSSWSSRTTGAEDRLSSQRVLSVSDLGRIFATVEPPLPPWSPVRAAKLFEQCPLRPQQHYISHGTSSSAGSPSSSQQQSPSGSPSSPILSGASSPTNTTIDDPDQHPHTRDSAAPSTSAVGNPLLSTSGISILSASDSLPSLGSAAMASRKSHDDHHHHHHHDDEQQQPLVSLSQPTNPATTTMTLSEWMGHWHLMAATSPAVTQLELYRLGFLPRSMPKSGPQQQQQQQEEQDDSKSHQRRAGRRRKDTKQADAATKTQESAKGKATFSSSLSPPSPLELLSVVENSRELRVLVLGGSLLGQDGRSGTAMTSELIQSLCCQGGATTTTTSASEAGSSADVVVEPDTTFAWANKEGHDDPEGWIETSQAHVILKRNSLPLRRSSTLQQQQDLLVHFLFYNVPDSLLPLVLVSNDDDNGDGRSSPVIAVPFDLVILAFEDLPGFKKCQQLERQYLRPDMRRTFMLVTTAAASRKAEGVGLDSSSSSKYTTLQAATHHCASVELEGQPLLWFTTRITAAGSGSESNIATSAPVSMQEQVALLTVLARCCLRGEVGIEGLLQSSPYEAQRRRREQLFQTIGLGVVGVVVVIGVGYFSLATSWFRSFFFPPPSSPHHHHHGQSSTNAAAVSASRAGTATATITASSAAAVRRSLVE